MKPIRKRAQVFLDLTAIYRWIGEQNPDAADRFLVAVDGTFEQIAGTRPLAGNGDGRIRNFTGFVPGV